MDRGVLFQWCRLEVGGLLCGPRGGGMVHGRCSVKLVYCPNVAISTNFTTYRSQIYLIKGDEIPFLRHDNLFSFYNMYT